MKIFENKWAIAIPFLLIIVLGCAKDQKTNIKSQDSSVLKFKSGQYGFSFSYPSDWKEINRDLPDKWALLDKDKNTILFLVNKAQSNNLLVLGRSQALRDLYPNNTVSDLKQQKIKELIKTVKLESFNNQSWYVYGVKFSDKNVDSLVSGTLCKDNEVMFVLVSDFLSFDGNTQTYKKILSTFEC